MNVFVVLLCFGTLVTGSVVGFITYRITHRPPPPPLSEYEKNKIAYIKTGNPDYLRDMEKELED